MAPRNTAQAGQFDARWFAQDQLSASEQLVDRADKSLQAAASLRGKMPGLERNRNSDPPVAQQAAPAFGMTATADSVQAAAPGSDAVLRNADSLKRSRTTKQSKRSGAKAAGWLA